MTVRSSKVLQVKASDVWTRIVFLPIDDAMKEVKVLVCNTNTVHIRIANILPDGEICVNHLLRYDFNNTVKLTFWSHLAPKSRMM